MLKLTEMPDKKVYYINIPDHLSNKEIDKFVEKVKKDFMKKSLPGKPVRKK